MTSEDIKEFVEELDKFVDEVYYRPEYSGEGYLEGPWGWSVESLRTALAALESALSDYNLKKASGL